jgi:hypothetical protein
MRLEQSAPVARTQIDRHQLGCGQPFEIVEREFGLAVGALAAEGDLPSPDVDLRDVGEMVTDEKRVVRGNGGAEIFERGLVVRSAGS